MKQNETEDRSENRKTKTKVFDFKDVHGLTKYVSEHGKIIPRRMSGVSQVQQKQIAKAVKRARALGLLGFTNRFNFK